MANRDMTAMLFLARELRDGPMYLDDIAKLAAKKNIARRSLYRAATMLGVRKRARGFGTNRYSIWRIDRALADQYRDQRVKVINEYNALTKALTRLAADMSDHPHAMSRVEEFRTTILRDISKLRAKDVDNL